MTERDLIAGIIVEALINDGECVCVGSARAAADALIAAGYRREATA